MSRYIDEIKQISREIVENGFGQGYLRTATGGEDCPWPIVRVLSDRHDRSMGEVDNDIRSFIKILGEQDA